MPDESREQLTSEEIRPARQLLCEIKRPIWRPIYVFNMNSTTMHVNLDVVISLLIPVVIPII